VVDPPGATAPHRHTEYAKKRDNTDRILLGLLLLLLLLTGVGILAWTIVQQTQINHNDNHGHKNKKNIQDVRDKCDALNETIQDCNCTELNTNVDQLNQQVVELNNTINETRQAILSKVSLTPSSALVNNTQNFPFDHEQYDPYDLYNTTSHEWTADRDGWWHFLACVTFDRDSTPGFNSSIAHDHQLQVFINDAATTQGLFAEVYTHHGHDSQQPELPQQAICGSNVYQLSTGETLTLRAQTRLEPFNILVSSVDGGLYVATRATLYFIGE
jgi:hypothetical protein